MKSYSTNFRTNQRGAFAASNNCKNLLLVTAVITEILEHNKVCGDHVKNAFRCESTQGEDRLCIYWERAAIEAGDTVQLKGWFNSNGVFIAKSLLIMKKNKTPSPLGASEQSAEQSAGTFNASAARPGEGSTHRKGQ